jgi:hypothetical protein
MKLSERDAKIVNALNNARQAARAIQADVEEMGSMAADRWDAKAHERITLAAVGIEALLAEAVQLLRGES